MRPNSNSSGRRSLPTALALLGLAALVALSGCSDPKKKAEKVFKRALAQCESAEGTFAEIDLLSGDESKEVLRAVCTSNEFGEITLDEEYSASTTLGPYTWEAGIDERTDVWTMKGISWETFDQARQRLETEDPGQNRLQHTVKLLAKAQKEFPASGWIRLRRLEKMVELNDKKIGGEKKPVEIGDAALEHLEETIAWAEENDRPDVKAEAQVYVANYTKDYIDLMGKAKENLGNQDDYFKKSIEVAEKEGDKEEAEKYRKELEEMRKKRPEMKKKYQSFIDDARQKLCRQIGQMSTDGIEDESIVQQVKGVQSGIDCEAVLAEDADSTDSE